MKKEQNIIFEAVNQIGQLLGLHAEVNLDYNGYDALMKLKGEQFLVEAQNEIRNSNKGIVVEQILSHMNATTIPFVVVANYISQDATQELRENNINYIDTAGNTFISHKDVLIHVSGQKNKRKSEKNKSRAFQEAGIKLIFSLITCPENLQLSYRELAAQSGISLGAVSTIMKELEKLNFILKTPAKRVLKNKKKLLERWVMAYGDVLKPRIFVKRMRLVKNDWLSLPIDALKNNLLWGGEPAAQLLTGRLKAEEFILYTDSNWQTLMPDLGMVPDEEGNIVVNRVFWNTGMSKNKAVPPLLIYADLLLSGYGRNIEIANKILEDELPDFK